MAVTTVSLHLVGIALCARYIDSLANPLDCLVVPVALLFFWVGHAASPWLLTETVWPGRPWPLISFTILSGAGAAAVFWMPGLFEVDLKVGALSPFFLASLLSTSLSILFLEAVRRFTPLSPVTGFAGLLGRASLTIMFVHPAVLYLAAMINVSHPGLVPTPMAVLAALAAVWRFIRLHRCVLACRGG